MKTNTKRVINILLTLVMIISLFTALGGAALAAPVLSGAAASLAGDDVTLAVTAAGADGAFASLRVVLRDPAEAPTLPVNVYVNQYVLADGANSIVFPIEAADLKGLVLRLTLAAATGDGTIVTFLAVNVDKDYLNDLIDNAPDDASLYHPAAWPAFEAALAAAILVRDDPFASQVTVDAAADALAAAIADLRFLATAIVINAPIATTVPRNVKIPFTFTASPDPAFIDDVKWSTSNATFATVDKDGLVTVLGKTGTVTLTATCTYTGTTYSIVLRIV